MCWPWSARCYLRPPNIPVVHWVKKKCMNWLACIEIEFNAWRCLMRYLCRAKWESQDVLLFQSRPPALPGSWDVYRPGQMYNPSRVWSVYSMVVRGTWSTFNDRCTGSILNRCQDNLIWPLSVQTSGNSALSSPNLFLKVNLDLTWSIFFSCHFL